MHFVYDWSSLSILWYHSNGPLFFGFCSYKNIFVFTKGHQITFKWLVFREQEIYVAGQIGISMSLAVLADTKNFKQSIIVVVTRIL